jgi:peptidoglycan hydrolase-like protein with peptidoglycan-binding domain
MLYTNTQFRSILNGLGFKEQGKNEPNFPLSDNRASLTDDATVQAIEQFQTYFHLISDGVAGSQTMATAERKMTVIHSELNQVLKTDLPGNQPFYEVFTVKAIRQFQEEYHFAIDGVASLLIRQQLYLLAHPGTTHEQIESLLI